MKFEATVKLLQEVKSGISVNTGNPYKYQGIILETQDGDHIARWLGSMGTKQVESFAQQGIKVGDRVIVDLSFQTYVNHNKYVENKVYVIEICLTPKQTQTHPQPLPLSSQGSREGSNYGDLPQIQYPTV